MTYLIYWSPYTAHAGRNLPVKEFCYLRTFPNLTAAVSGRLFSFPRPSITLHSPLNEAPKAASGSEGGTSERPTSRRKATSGGGEWGVRGTTIGRPLTTLTPSHSAPVRLVHSVHSSRGAVWTERMRDERERKWPTLARGSLSYLFLVSPSEGRPGGRSDTRERTRREWTERREADRASLISASLITVRLLSSSLPFPLPSVTNGTGRERRERTVTWRDRRDEERS